MYKLDVEKAEELEIKLPTFPGSQKKQVNSEKHLLLLHWLHYKGFDCVDHNKLWNIFKETGIQTTLLSPWETSMPVKKQ